MESGGVSSHPFRNTFPFAKQNRAKPRVRAPRAMLAAGAASVAMVGPIAPPAHAQTSVVSACTGVSLPRSVVTGIVGQVLTPTLGQVETLLDSLLLGTVNLNLSGTLASAAAGDPIRLNALDINGNSVDVLPTTNCVSQADGYSVATPGGISIGGNRITGLGANGPVASAGALTAVAIGDGATTGAGLGGAIALGAGATVTGGTASIALGQNSAATGTTLGQQAYLVGGTATSELAIGSRRITGLAAGAADGDAVNVGQLRAATTAALQDTILYDPVASLYRASRAGVAQKITGVANGTVAAGSTDAVNGGQLAVTNASVVAVDANVSIVGNRVTSVEGDVAGLQQNALLYNGSAYAAARGGTAQRITGVANGTVTAGSTEAVNGGQLAATNTAVTNVDARVTTVDNRVTTIEGDIVGLQQDALLYDGTAYTAQRGGAAQRITGVADGTVAAGSTDAVNGGQLAATNTAVTNVDARVTTVDNRVTTVDNRVTTIEGDIVGLQQDALLYDGTAYTAQRGGTAQRITGVADGAVSAGSTDAVNGGQLAGTNAALGQLALDLDGLEAVAVRYDAAGGGTLTLAGAAGTRITNLADGGVSATSSDAVTGAQLFATEQRVDQAALQIAAVDGRVTTVEGDVAGLRQDALLYDGTAYSAGRGGVAQRVTGVAPGAIAAGSSDAVTGGQLFGVGSGLASAFGGGSQFNPATGQIQVDLGYDGGRYDSVQSALDAVQVSVSNVATSRDIRYFATNSTGADARAVGIDATAIGVGALADGEAAVAAGRNAMAMDGGSVAIGDGAQAIQGKSVSIGFANVAAGDGAVAIGDPNIATGAGAIALGRDNEATGTGAVALGDTNLGTGSGSVVLGVRNVAVGEGALAVGRTNAVTGDNAIALGSNNDLVGENVVAIGTGSVLNGDFSVGIGAAVRTSGVDSVAIGNGSAAFGFAATSFGNRATVNGQRAMAIGADTSVTGDFSMALGSGAQVDGLASMAIGINTRALTSGGVAVGAGATVSHDGSVALGTQTSTTRGGVSGYAAFGLGVPQNSQGEIAIGRNTPYTTADGVVLPVGDRQLTGLSAGSADSDGVNVAQLRGAATQIGTGVAAALGGGASYDGTTGAFTAPSYTVNGTTYASVGAALQGLGAAVGTPGGTANALTYDDPDRTQVTLAGGGGTRVSNLRDGTVAAGSSDAVTGGQLYVLQQGLADVNQRIGQLGQGGGTPALSPLEYVDVSGDPVAPGTVTNDVRLAGAGGQPVRIRNVAAGQVAAGSTEAVNGGQLYAVQQSAANSVQYDRNADGSRADRIALSGGSGGPVTISNVAAGVSTTDAVNVGQLNARVDQAVASAGAYTDQRVGELRSSLSSLRRDSEAATAAAMALAAVPQPYGPGMGMFGMGMSAWGGESALAIGAAKASDEGGFVFKAGATYNTRGKGGASFGAGWAF